MKSTTFKITLASILAVFALTGCGNADLDSKESEKQSTAASVSTTTAVSAESAPAAVTTSAEKTEAVQPAQTEETQPEQTEAVQQEQIVAVQPEQTEIAQPVQISDTAVVQNESKTDAITEKQALDAIMKYCYDHNPNLKNIVDSGEYPVYWDAKTNDANEIVVLYRSYTAAQTRYYIDPVSGNTYVTELVPGIIDEEQRTDESFNVRDYLQ